MSGLSGRLRDRRGESVCVCVCLRAHLACAEREGRGGEDERQPGEVLELVLRDGKRTRGLERREKETVEQQREEEVVVIPELRVFQ